MDEDEWARRVCLGTEGAEVASWDRDDFDIDDDDEADGFDFGEADTCTEFLGDIDDIM